MHAYCELYSLQMLILNKCSIEICSIIILLFSSVQAEHGFKMVNDYCNFNVSPHIIFVWLAVH